MTYPDLLLHIESYPTPTPAAGIQEAIDIAVSLGGRVTGLAVEIEIEMHSNRLADYLIGLSSIAGEEEAKSRAACREGLAYFAAKAKAAGVFQASIMARVNHLEAPDRVATVARAYDLCLLPLAGGYDGQVAAAQAVVFSSGRPVLIFRGGDAAGLAAGADLAVVAWDGSRSAARAMADALPILVRAKRVQVLQVLNEKTGAGASPVEEAQRHLRAHGVEASVVAVDSEGATIGEVLDSHIGKHSPDLLVMGAYGHSRAREFFLGGATEHVLKRPLCPVFLSH